MTKSTLQVRPIAYLFIPFLMLLSIVLLAKSDLFIGHSDTIGRYLAFDLLLTVPLLYFWAVRKTSIPNTTTVPVIFLGLILGYNILPPEQHLYLDMFKSYGLPVIEVSVLAFVVLKVRGAIRSFKAHQRPGADFYNVLQETVRELVPGRLSGFLVSEISVIYYGFLNWKKKELKSNEYSYHMRSGTPALFGALIFMIMVETFAVHLILVKWSSIAALVLTILSIYSAMQFLGFARAFSKRPFVLENGKIVLRYGILNEAIIDVAHIDGVEVSRRPLDEEKEERKLSLLGDFESHNIIITCRQSQVMKGIYGLNRTFSTLAIHVDEKDQFVQAVQEEMKRSSIE